MKYFRDILMISLAITLLWYVYMNQQLIKQNKMLRDGYPKSGWMNEVDVRIALDSQWKDLTKIIERQNEYIKKLEGKDAY